MKRADLISVLPFDVDTFHFRNLERSDIDSRCNWPPYPIPYEGFDSSLKQRSEKERNERFGRDNNDANRLYLAVEESKKTLIGTFGLLDIDWQNYIIGNMAIRVHPYWCDKGTGTHLLLCVMHWLKVCGFRQVRLDVMESNQRARRCYQKVGFVKTGFLVRESNRFILMTLQLKNQVALQNCK
jgi:RimJ/RimL family protein N-acetyltransferase